MPREEAKGTARVPEPLAEDVPKGLGAALQGKNDETPKEVPVVPAQEKPSKPFVDMGFPELRPDYVAPEPPVDAAVIGSKLKVGDYVGKGNRQISNSHGEFLVNPDTGKVTKCL